MKNKETKHPLNPIENKDFLNIQKDYDRCSELKAIRDYENVCNELARKFAKKHGLNFSRFCGEEVEIAYFEEDYYFCIDDIVRDLKTNQPRGFILQWYKEDLASLDSRINYKSYILGMRYD